MLHISYKLEGNNPYWQLEDADTHEVLIPFGKYQYMKINGDYICCELKGGKGLLDSNENIILPFEYDWIGEPEISTYFPRHIFRRVIQSGLFGLIDANCKTLLPSKYELIQNIANLDHVGSFYHVMLNKTMLSYNVSDLIGKGSDQIAQLIQQTEKNIPNIRVKQNEQNQWGVEDEDGKVIVEYGCFDWIEAYHGNFARARKFFEVSANNTIRDKDGNIIINKDMLLEINDVCSVKKAKNFIIDRSGQIVKWRDYWNYIR